MATVRYLESSSLLSSPPCDSPPNVRSVRFHLKKKKQFSLSTLRCSLKPSENPKNGDEPPESLFMKELKKRGMNPTSLLDETEEIEVASERRTTVELEKELASQRERSMALNSEGLEGLVPRAKLLLSLGGTFFLSFGPLILITIGAFAALYLYFGSAFVHDGSDRPVSPPPYIDPYALLEDEMIS